MKKGLDKYFQRCQKKGLKPSELKLLKNTWKRRVSVHEIVSPELASHLCQFSAETHRQVPTYNYVVVHAYGRLTVHDDERWLRALLGRLTRKMEAPQPKPWKMGDAPQDFLRDMLGNIVGIEIAVTRLVGKWKVSQNRLPVDQQGASSGLRATGDPDAAAIADRIRDTAARIRR